MSPKTRDLLLQFMLFSGNMYSSLQLRAFKNILELKKHCQTRCLFQDV